MLAGQADVGRDYVVQRVEGMRAFLDGEMIQDMEAPGCVINRDVFDQAIASAAEKAGARILLGSAAVGREGGDHGPVLLQRADGEETLVDCRVVVGADGPFSRVAGWMGLPRLRCLPAVQVRLPLLEPMVHTRTYFDDEYPAGYAWLFPKGEEANVGVGMTRHPGGGGLAAALGRFAGRLAAEGVVGEEALGRTCGWVPVARRETFVAGDAVLAGDAAGHAHPITGAGVFQAVMGGAMAGRWAAEAVRKGDAGRLREYAREWEDFYGDVLVRAQSRRELWERHRGPVGEIIRTCWVGFREYYT
jgi:flavin-dependent dehydrogenase